MLQFAKGFIQKNIIFRPSLVRISYWNASTSGGILIAMFLVVRISYYGHFY